MSTYLVIAEQYLWVKYLFQGILPQVGDTEADDEVAVVAGKNGDGVQAEELLPAIEPGLGEHTFMKSAFSGRGEWGSPKQQTKIGRLHEFNTG